jgi:hypothetical protein
VLAGAAVLGVAVLLEAALPLHEPLPLQLPFAPGAALSVVGAAAGGLSPPQPASTPMRIPETADTARALPIFIFQFLLEAMSCAKRETECE